MIKKWFNKNAVIIQIGFFLLPSASIGFFQDWPNSYKELFFGQKKMVKKWGNIRIFWVQILSSDWSVRSSSKTYYFNACNFFENDFSQHLMSATFCIKVARKISQFSQLFLSATISAYKVVWSLLKNYWYY